MLPRHATLAAITALTTACSASGGVRSMGHDDRTAHERYGSALRDAGLDSTALGREWLASADSALQSPYALALPAREVGAYTRDEARAVAWSITLRDGERLRVSVRADGPRARLYLDLFERSSDSVPVLAHRASGTEAVAPGSMATTLTLEQEARHTGTYVLRLQPELLREGRYTLEARVEPILAFPVEGRGNAAIQSLFGVDRDGGRRAHHGIDIFAPRGTPALAATDGVVRSISPNTLGGNVVWLADEQRNQVLYYAHLDRHHVTAGQRVRQGDTVGFVGNTGNARTTAPHLHFGIYRRPEGPVDPLRYVRLVIERPRAVTADTSALGRPAVARRGALVLRETPVSPPLGAVRGRDSVRVMGAAGDAYRVQRTDGTSGYVTAEALRVLPEPARRQR